MMRRFAILVALFVGVACGGQTEQGGDAGLGVTGTGANGGSGASTGVGSSGGVGVNDGGSSSGGIGSSGGLGGFGGNLGAGEALGRACETDTECNGLKCLLADSGAFAGSGPAKGLCTVYCGTDATLCASVKPSALCADFGGGAEYCVEGCTFGPQASQSFDPSKCHGRYEMACSYYAPAQAPACLPRCNNDADCGSEPFCDPATGLCSSGAPTGKTLGEPCAPASDGGTDTCRGTCTTLTHPNGQPFSDECSEGCTIGVNESCGWGGPGTGPAPAACLFADPIELDNGGPGIGDLGRCGQLCSCNTDCKDPTLVCLSFDNPQLELAFGKKGYCGDPLGDDGGVNPGLPTCQ